MQFRKKKITLVKEQKQFDYWQDAKTGYEIFRPAELELLQNWGNSTKLGYQAVWFSQGGCGWVYETRSVTLVSKM